MALKCRLQWRMTWQDVIGRHYPMFAVNRKVSIDRSFYGFVVMFLKSYAGEQRIGPFHKSIMAVIGPNESGKSNVIDAMLFVFGKRVKQMHFVGFVDTEDMNLSSGRRKYTSLAGYSNSKLAQIKFSSILQKRIPAEAGVNVVCANPGIVHTNVLMKISSTPQRFWLPLLNDSKDLVAEVLFGAAVADPQGAALVRAVVAAPSEGVAN